MKRKILKEVQLCDNCGEETYTDGCLGCGVDHCHECRKINGTEYTHSLYASGSCDGYFCVKCDKDSETNPILPNEIRNLLYWYREIQAMRKNNNDYYNRTKERADEAEKEIRFHRERLKL